MNGFIKIGRNSLIYWLASAIPAFFGFLLLPVYTRYLTPSEYGILAMLAALAAPLAILLSLQLNTAVLRFFFQYEGNERRGYLGTIWLFLLIYSLPIGLGLILFGQPLFEKIFKAEELTFYPFVVWQLIITFLSLAWIVPSTVFKARQEAGKWASFALASVVLGTALTLYFIVVQKEGAVGVIRASLITQTIMFLIYIYIIYRNVSFNFSGHKLKESLIFGMPMLPSAIIGYILSFADRWFLERYWTLAEVGLYSLAFSFAHLLGRLYTASGDAWMPVFFNTANKDETQAKSLLSRTVTLWAAGGGLIALAIAFFSEEVIMLMTTPRFYPAYTVVPVLVFTWFLMGVRFYPRYALLFVKQTKAILMITSVSATVNVLANFILIPRYGMFGAAYSALIANIAALAITYLVVQKYYPVKFEYARLAKILGTMIILLVMVNFFSTESWFFNVPIKLGALLVYSLVLIYFGVIERSWLVQIKNNLNLKSLIRLLKG